jgi:hypothetical protein
MIAAGKRVNGEFYVAPVYNELIAAGARIGIDNIGVDGRGMYGLGTPADYEAFLRLPVSHRAAGTRLAAAWRRWSRAGRLHGVSKGVPRGSPTPRRVTFGRLFQ